jgi:methylated-DNA-[protein]-cysteine S-methyltransferase
MPMCAMQVDWCELATPFGPVHLAATDVGVVGVWFGAADDALAALTRDLGQVDFVEDGPHVAPARTQVEEYLRGERHAFDLALDWRRSKGFRRRVLQELAAVPFGVTVSYGELARRCGSPSATRAVGSAMATNPLPVIVPCHRVVRSGGAIGGFAGARNAIDTKRWLLTHEGVLTPFSAAR